MSQPVIITCAVTGSIHTPTMSPHLPITPSEIADAGAAQAGAAVTQLHARHPENGRPGYQPETFLEFLPRIKKECDAVINISTGGGAGITIEERLAAALTASPEMASLNERAADRKGSWGIESLGMTAATPDEARNRLALKGADRVEF